MMKKIFQFTGIFSFLILVMLFPLLSFAAITTPYYRGWENESIPLNTDVGRLDGNCNGFDNKGASSTCVIGDTTSTCCTTIQNEFPARYGDKYLQMRCYYDGNPNHRNATHRAGNLYIEGFSAGGADCMDLIKDDGTEYWFGFSGYIPENYPEDLHTHGYWQVHNDDAQKSSMFLSYGNDQSNGPTYVIGNRDVGASGDEAKTYFGNWKNDKGKWTDWVLHIVLFTENDSRARYEYFYNGVKVYERIGKRNIDRDIDGHIYFNMFCYSWAFKGRTCELGDSYLTDEDNDGDIDQTDEDLCIDRYILNPDSPTYRLTIVDEFRFTQQLQGSGNYNYCDVAPPIIPEKSSMTYPTNNSTSIPTNPTIRYNEYTDHRDDPQSCFSYNKTQIQIDEYEGNWSSPVYESTSVAQNSKSVTGLLNNTHYQMRIRHKSIRQGSTEVYEGDWSDTVSFTTQTGSTSIRADVDQQNGINSTDAMLTLRNSLSLDMSQTAWQESATTGDVNCDGTSNSTDAMLILRHSVGLSMSGTGWCE